MNQWWIPVILSVTLVVQPTNNHHHNYSVGWRIVRGALWLIFHIMYMAALPIYMKNLMKMEHISEYVATTEGVR